MLVCELWAMLVWGLWAMLVCGLGAVLVCGLWAMQVCGLESVFFLEYGLRSRNWPSCGFLLSEHADQKMPTSATVWIFT